MAEDEQAHRGACRVGRRGGPGRRLSSDDGARADDREVDPEQALDKAAEPIRPGRNGRRSRRRTNSPEARRTPASRASESDRVGSRSRNC